MKVSNEDYNKLKLAIFTMLKDRGLHPFMVQDNKTAWDCFNLAKCHWMYDQGYNDSHINTALNRIFKSVRG